MAETTQAQSVQESGLPLSAANVPASSNGAVPAGPAGSTGPLEQRIAALEASRATATDDLSDLLNIDFPSTATEVKIDTTEPEAAAVKEKSPTSKCACGNPCVALWGGPIMPTSSHSIW